MRSLLLAFSCAVSSVGVMAQVTVPNTFAAGSPARAADVNANFQALATAINGLTTRVNRLEGGLAAADIPGTYNFSVLNLMPLAGAPNDFWDVNVVKSTLTLAAGGTFTSTGTESNASCCGSGTWSYAGNVLTLTLSGPEVLTFQTLAVGNLFITSRSRGAGVTDDSLFFLARLR